MKNIAVLTAVALAAWIVVTVPAVPIYAAQSAVAMNNPGIAVDTVVGTQGSVPAQLVMRGHGGGGHAFRSGGFRSFHGARFNRFNRFHFRTHRFVRPFVYSTVYPYSSSYYNNCVWNGYKWVCYDDLY
jgi:hypothetical protein